MDQPWNREIEHVDVIRVKGWDALLQWLHVRHVGHWPKSISESLSLQQFSPLISMTLLLTRPAADECSNHRTR